jgi:DHA2 family multidrug resistance protein
MNYTSIWAGLAVAPLGIAPLVLSVTIGWVISRFGKIIPLFICLILFALSCFYTAYFDTSVDFNHVALSRLFMGFAILFFMTPLMALSIQDIPSDHLPSATGFFHFVRAMFGGVGTAIYTTMWVRRGAFHHERIGSTLTPYTESVQDFFSKAEELAMSKGTSLALLNSQLSDESAMMSINDCFYFMGWVFLGLIVLLPLGRKKRNPTASLKI